MQLTSDLSEFASLASYLIRSQLSSGVRPLRSSRHDTKVIARHRELDTLRSILRAIIDFHAASERIRPSMRCLREDSRESLNGGSAGGSPPMAFAPSGRLPCKSHLAFRASTRLAA